MGGLSATEREVLEAVGADPRLAVPGSLVVRGHSAEWTQMCRVRCRHDDGLCHAARSAYVPPSMRHVTNANTT